MIPMQSNSCMVHVLRVRYLPEVIAGKYNYGAQDTIA